MRILYTLAVSFCIHAATGKDSQRPLNIAHRGTSGTFPENTMAGFQKAVEIGADFMECDLLLTRDLQPVCHHDLWLSEVTDVASHPAFADRKTTYYIGSYGNVTDWFVIDFTLDELKTLRTYQRFDFRDSSKDGEYPIPTLSEFISVAQGAADGTVGIYPELKNPEWQNSHWILNGTRMEDIILAQLEGSGYTDATDSCVIQSFDEESILYVASASALKTSILLNDDSWETKLPEWGQKLFSVGPSKTLIAHYYDEDNGYKNWITGTSSLVDDAHAVGLQVHAYTFRNEDRYLAWDFQQDPMQEYDFFLDLGIDGIHTDFPETFENYLDSKYPDNGECDNGGSDEMCNYTISVLVLSVITSVISWR